MVEYWLENGVQPTEQGPLTHAIIDRRYAEHSVLAGFVPLRDRVLPNRQWLKSPTPPIPLFTLRCAPRDAKRKTRGQVDRYSFLVRLFHPLLHAGLSRRTNISIALSEGF